MESLRMDVRDAIEECLIEKHGIRVNWAELTCDISDVIFNVLGISDEEQDIVNPRVSIKITEK